jgi:hypothetical protein
MTKYIFPVKASIPKKIKYAFMALLYEFPLLKFRMANRAGAKGINVPAKP